MARIPSISARRAVLLGLAATVVLGFLTGNILTGVAVVAVTAVILVGLLGRHGRSANIETQSRWRFVPLAAAAVLVPLVWATWGAAILLAPVGVILTLAALRKLPTWRDPILLAGAVANGYLAVGFLATAAIFAHDALT